MSSFASPIPPPVFDSDESDVASQQSTDSSYLASQFNRRTRLSFSPKLTVNRSSSQVLPPSSVFFDESTCGSCSQPMNDDSMNIESALSRLTTLSQTPSEISYQSSPIASHFNHFKSPCQLRCTPSSVNQLSSKPKTSYTVKYANNTTTSSSNSSINNNKRKRSTTRTRDRDQSNSKIDRSEMANDRVSLKTPDQSPCTRRKNLDYVQESTFRSPKVQRRSRHHDESINLTSSTSSNDRDQSIRSKGNSIEFCN